MVLTQQIKDMENKNMTAVEWIINKLRQLAHDPTTHIGMGDVRVTQGMIDELEEQSKQMEKEQLENARPQIVSNCVIKEISDEEIRYAAYQDDSVNMGMEPEVAFIDGAKWYREQLKNK